MEILVPVCLGTMAYISYKLYRLIKGLTEEQRIVEEKIRKQIKSAISKGKKELDLMKSDKTPTEEDIRKYYRMYLKKQEIANRSQWNARETVAFEDFRSRALDKTEIIDPEEHISFRQIGGYEYLVSMTSDGMIGIPPNHSYMRIYDYEGLVKEERNEKSDYITK